MAHKWILAGMLWAVVGATLVSAEEPSRAAPPNPANGGALATVRTIAYLPFKGVVCVVGVLASFPVYWLSGMDPQVKSDTEAMRARYCSREYFLGSEWSR
ncbi:MAG TPA: hypothetical protein VNN62_04440 [Methylomirabilota bacterium]|jgi:hypothetical protein|nr:hypothetical protein [Methylomirabilota bacterium]